VLSNLPSARPRRSAHAEQHVAPRDDGVRAFEFGLDLILGGLKRAARVD
jgi:hypothetical protein